MGRRGKNDTLVGKHLAPTQKPWTSACSCQEHSLASPASTKGGLHAPPLGTRETGCSLSPLPPSLRPTGRAERSSSRVCLLVKASSLQLRNSPVPSCDCHTLNMGAGDEQLASEDSRCGGDRKGARSHPPGDSRTVGEDSAASRGSHDPRAHVSCKACHPHRWRREGWQASLIGCSL